jgi:NAD(P)-dependent dehydrogenase (short-subunit alcohol dehydrogenase family)
MTDFSGKVVIVTGGSSGIGLATARIMAAGGAQVVIAGRTEATLRRAVDEIGADRCEGVLADVAHPEDNFRIVEATQRRFGGVDVFVGNAGIGLPFASIVDQPIDAFDRLMAVNVRGAFLGLKAAIPAIRARGGGNIVLTSSIAGLKARGSGNAAYVASKHAVVGLTRTAAVECGPLGIRVNCVLPGPTDTPMIHALAQSRSPNDLARGKEDILRGMPLGRYGTADEVAHLIAFLGSDRAGFCTGGIYSADGGMSAM